MIIEAWMKFLLSHIVQSSQSGDWLKAKKSYSPHKPNYGSNPRHIAHYWKAENISFLTMCYISGVVGLVEHQLRQKWETHFHVALFCLITDILHRFLQNLSPWNSVLAHYCNQKTINKRIPSFSCLQILVES